MKNKKKIVKPTFKFNKVSLLNIQKKKNNSNNPLIIEYPYPTKLIRKWEKN